MCRVLMVNRVADFVASMPSNAAGPRPTEYCNAFPGIGGGLTVAVG